MWFGFCSQKLILGAPSKHLNWECLFQTDNSWDGQSYSWNLWQDDSLMIIKPYGPCTSLECQSTLHWHSEIWQCTHNNPGMSVDCQQYSPVPSPSHSGYYLTRTGNETSRQSLPALDMCELKQSVWHCGKVFQRPMHITISNTIQHVINNRMLPLITSHYAVCYFPTLTLHKIVRSGETEICTSSKYQGIHHHRTVYILRCYNFKATSLAI
jgi:hypothetical protein